MFKPNKTFHSKKMWPRGSATLCAGSDLARRSIAPIPFSDERHIRIDWERHPGGYTTMHQTCMMTGQHRKIAVPSEISRHDARGLGAMRYEPDGRDAMYMTATEASQRQKYYMKQKAWEHLTNQYGDKNV
jgi:hypothetical protein